MNFKDYEKVTKLYQQGFKCIKYEDDQNGQFTAFFKNFEDEKIDSLLCNNDEEIAKIKDYIDNHWSCKYNIS